MSTRTTPKVSPLIIPITSGFTPWLALSDMLPVAVQTPTVMQAGNLVVRGRLATTGAFATGGLVFDDNPDSSGVQLVIASGADRCIRLDERLFLGLHSIQFSCDGQLAARTILVALLGADVLLGTAR